MAEKTTTTTLRVVFVDVGKSPIILTIDNTFEAMQAVVKGTLDCVSVEEGIDLWVNDEGMIRDMDANVLLPGYGFIFGPVFLAASNSEGDTISFTEEQALVWAAVASTWGRPGKPAEQKGGPAS